MTDARNTFDAFKSREGQIPETATSSPTPKP
jgi:hypothetical protein